MLLANYLPQSSPTFTSGKLVSPSLFVENDTSTSLPYSQHTLLFSAVTSALALSTFTTIFSISTSTTRLESAAYTTDTALNAVQPIVPMSSPQSLTSLLTRVSTSSSGNPTASYRMVLMSSSFKQCMNSKICIQLLKPRSTSSSEVTFTVIMILTLIIPSMCVLPLSCLFSTHFFCYC